MSSAEEARFLAFVESTESQERDWTAFVEFENAVLRATMCATMSNPYDAEPHYRREYDDLYLALSEMLYRVLSRVPLGTLLADVEGIGYALRFGIIPQRADALDDIAESKAFEELAAEGYAAEQADTERRMAEIGARNAERERKRVASARRRTKVAPV